MHIVTPHAGTAHAAYFSCMKYVTCHKQIDRYYIEQTTTNIVIDTLGFGCHNLLYLTLSYHHKSTFNFSLQHVA